MIKQFLSIIAFATLLFVTPAISAPACEYKQSQFHSDAAESKMVVWGISAKGTKLILDKVNEVRANRGAEAYDADTILFGVFQHNNQLLAAIMFFKDGCRIPNSTLILPAGVWAQAVASLGLTDADFIKMREASNGQ